MGQVYRARDGRLGRDVAIKVLPPYLADDAGRRVRMEREARAMGMLNHPSIVTVHDIGDHHGALFIVSELLEGVTLRERVAGTGGLGEVTCEIRKTDASLVLAPRGTWRANRTSP